MQFRENIKKMKPYKPPLEGRNNKDFLLLDFNERTTEPDLKVKEALKRFIDAGLLQVYPSYGGLEEKIASYVQVEPAQVMLSNGADQGIDLVCRAHLSDGDKVIIPSPAFAMHYQSAEMQGASILEPPYKEDGSFPLDEVLDLIEKSKRLKLVILCNPSNPLGSAIPLEGVEAILKKAQGRGIAVLHDEAYFEFSNITAKDLLSQYGNLYLVRTFSKAFGLVSARAGYIVSQKQNLEELLKIRGPYDINMFAKTAVEAALENISYMKEYVREVMENSKPAVEKFLREKGVDFLPSSANFIFLKVKEPSSVIEALKEKGVLVRPKQGPNGRPGVRVGLGTLADSRKLLGALESAL